MAQLSSDVTRIPGKNVFGKKLLNQEGDTVTLEEFRGKFLYVDFWFSQCKPCIAEIPFAKRLKSQMENENIAFINISFDVSNARWRETIEKYDIQGVNYRVAGRLKEEFIITVFPRYWLVSPEGNILNPGAGRPSDYVDNDLLKKEMDEVH